VIEFADYQCPVCGAYERVLDSMRTKHPKDFAVVFHDFPLSYHPLAMPLAIAARCADYQGSYLAFHDSVFAEHDELGVVSIEDFARRAGVANIVAFRRCMRDSTVRLEVNADVAMGKRLKLSGTPSVIANGVLHTSDLHVDDFENLLPAGR
jgi:protein-disulfide isomerase